MSGDLPFVLVIVLPFLGALAVAAARGRAEKAAPYAAVIFGLATAAASIIALPAVHTGEGRFGLLPDGLGYSIALVSSVLGALVLIYSLGYMAHEHGQPRYYELVLLTVGATNGLGLSGNALALAGFWIFCSFLTGRLVGFHREDPAAQNGARKAVALARAGDLLLILGLGLLYFASGEGSFSLAGMIEGAAPGKRALVALSAYVILLAAMVRSAQIPMHVWLPGAMEAPSSASALLDAATVMNAGVYLVMRFYPAFAGVTAWTKVVLWVGAVTVLLSALMALYAADIKKMLAYSTMSQLGYMFLAVGVGSFLGAQFHMVSHAIFKSLLFLSAGSVVHATGTRDMGLLSGVGSKMPTTGTAFLIGVMGLSGVPFMSGFFSKDMILAGALSHHEYGALILAGIGAVLTVTYSWSAYFKVFSGPESPLVRSAHEAPLSMEIPLVILAILTPLSWLAIGVESDQLGHTVPGLEVHSISPLYLIEETFASPAFIISLAALAIGLVVVRRRERVLPWLDAHASSLVTACRQGFYFDRLFAAVGSHRGASGKSTRRA